MLRWVDYPNEEPSDLQQQMWRILTEPAGTEPKQRDLTVRARFVMLALALPVLTSGAWMVATAFGLGSR